MAALATFRGLWQTVLEGLQADADTLQVAPTAIQAGVVEFDNEGRLIVPGMAPPFLYVYCMPGTGQLSEAATPTRRTATIAILATPEQSDSIDGTVCNATELAERIEQTVRTRLRHLRAADPGIAIDKPGSGTIRALIAFEAQYKSSTEP